MQGTLQKRVRTALASHSNCISTCHIGRPARAEKRMRIRVASVARPPPVDTCEVGLGVEEVEASSDQIDWRQQWCAHRDLLPVLGAALLGRSRLTRAEKRPLFFAPRRSARFMGLKTSVLFAAASHMIHSKLS